MTSGISAEYGRFGGGVVNMITKSGGNEFSGSLRLNLTNDDWVARNPADAEATDEIEKLWEGTLGGFAWRDHLWFFLAYRDRPLVADNKSSDSNWSQDPMYIQDHPDLRNEIDRQV